MAGAKLVIASEWLEDRTLLSAIVFDAAPTTEMLTLSLDASGNLQISEEGTVVVSQPLSSVDEVTITGNNLDNTLFVDFSNGNPIPAGGLTYDGVNRGTDFDVLDFGDVTVDSIIGHAIDEHDGSLSLVFANGDVANIAYVNIEPISSSINATDVTLNYSTAVETITVSDAGGGQTTVNSTAGEITTFNNPTGTLTINSGDTGVNVIDVDSLLASYPANLDINGGNSGDTVNLNGAISFAAGKSLTVDGATINLPNAASDITTSGSGVISLAATINIELSSGSSLTTNGGSITLAAADEVYIEASSITSGGGNIVFNGDTDPGTDFGGTVTIIDDYGGGNRSTVDSGGGNLTIGGGADPATTAVTAVADASGIGLNDGVTIFASDLSAGAGNISIRGNGQDDGDDGVDIYFEATITTTSGNITIVGSSSADEGVEIGSDTGDPASTVTTTSGTITITGASSSTDDRGVLLGNASLDSGTGNINITGDTSGPDADDGVHIEDGSQVNATSGNITIIGTTTSVDDGVEIHEESSLETTSGNISITGTASGADSEDGILIHGSSGFETTISTQTGMITLDGTGGSMHSGVQLDEYVIVQSTGATGAGTVTIDGTSDNADPDPSEEEAGTIILDSIVRSVSGAIDIDGTSINGHSLVIDTGSMIQSTGTGADAASINLTGDGGGLFGTILAKSSVTSVDGNISISGDGGSDVGVLLYEGSVSSTGMTIADAAMITINGTSSGDDAVLLSDNGASGSLVSSDAGRISITGDASGGGANGIMIQTASEVNSTGTLADAASINFLAIGGSDNGVEIGGTIASADGAIVLGGSAASGENGVQVDLLVQATGVGTILISGQGNTAAGKSGVEVNAQVSSATGTTTIQAPVGQVLVAARGSVTSTTGSITLRTNDAAASGDDVSIAATANVTSTSGGEITLSAGDDVLLPLNATVSTSGNVLVLVDASDADSGTGGAFELLGSLNAAAVSATGGPDNDTIDFSGVASFVVPVTFVGNGGDDVLTGGDGADTFQWAVGDGSDQIDGDGGSDAVELTSGTATTVTYGFVSNSDGTISDGAHTITYTGLEPIIDNLSVTDRVFSFTGAGETITLSDDATVGDGVSRIDSTLGELVDFVNPTGSLTVLTGNGTGADSVSLQGLDSTYDADLIITVQADDSVTFESSATDVDTGDVTVTTSDLAINSALSSTGDLLIIPASASDTIGIGGGSGTLNIDDTHIGNLTDGFNSITIGDARNGTGAVDIESSAFTDDVTIIGGSISVTELDVAMNDVALTARTGDISDGGDAGADINGSGGVTLNAATGVGTSANAIDTTITAISASASTSGGIFIADTDGLVLNSLSAAMDGDVDVSTGNGQLELATGQSITTTGTGAITLISDRNIMLAAGSSLTTANGGITLDANPTGTTAGDFIGLGADDVSIQTTGTGNISLSGRGASNGNINQLLHGISLGGGTVVSSTANGVSAGTITFSGVGGDGTGVNYGVRLEGAGTTVTSVDGDISLTGRGGNGVYANSGVALTQIDSMSSTGTGTNAASIVITGTGGDGSLDGNTGIFVYDSDVTSVDGTITLVGQGGSGTHSVLGVDIRGAATISSTGASTGTVSVTGTGGTGTDFNAGIRLNDLGTAISSVNADVTVNAQGGGTGLHNNYGMELVADAVLQVTNGKLTVSASAGSGDTNGLVFGGDSGHILSLGMGPIEIYATGRGTRPDIHALGDPIFGGASAAGDIAFHADSLDFGGSTVQSSGNLLIQPRTPGTSIGIGGGAGDLNVAGIIAESRDGFSSITIGDIVSRTGTVDIGRAVFTDPVIIAGGAIHDGFGTDITAPSVTLHGTISPGQSPGVLTVVGDFSFANNSTFEVEIGGADPGESNTNHDQLNVTGMVTIGSNVTLSTSLYNGFMPVGGESLTIIENDGSDAVTGTFDGLSEDTALTIGGVPFVITYAGGDGNDVQLLAPSIEFGAATYSFDEDGAPAISLITLNRDTDVGTSVVQVTFPETGTATTTTDYTNTAINVTFNPGDTSHTIVVPIVDDAIVEQDETFGAVVSATSGTSIGSQSTTTVTIANNDSATLSINNVERAEGDSGVATFTFTVTLDAEVDTAVTVDYDTNDDTATASNAGITGDEDYTANTGNSLTFAANSPAGSTMTFSVLANGDDTVELTESFFVNLSNIVAFGRAVAFATGGDQGVGTITNDDTAEFRFEADAGGNEDAGVITVTVLLTNAVDVETTVDVSSTDGTARIADSDYTAITNQTLTFAAGVTSQTFAVTPTSP